jgi:hypothetical protein
MATRHAAAALHAIVAPHSSVFEHNHVRQVVHVSAPSFRLDADGDFEVGAD